MPSDQDRWAQYAVSGSPTSDKWGKYAVSQGASATPSVPNGAISAAPKPTWLQDAESDVRLGGNRTLVGKTLGRLQGSDKYSGLGGVSEGTQNFMGSPVLGLLHAGQSAQTIPEHPIKGTIGTALGLSEAATIPSLVAAGPVAKIASDSIPSAKYAGKILESVMGDAAHAPVTPSAISDPLLRLNELGQRGSTVPKAARQLLTRLTDPEAGPLAYRESRDFASNISRLSSNEAQKVTPVVKKALGDLRTALHSDIGAAADTVGRGQDYSDAIREYANASRISDAGKKAIGWGAKGLGVGAAYEGYQKLKRLL